METTVKIKAIPMLSKIDGCKSKSGKISNCIKIARIKPLPTSIILSIISLFIYYNGIIQVVQVVWYLTIPITNTAIATAFKNINALSCHNIPTTNQPLTPIKCKYKLYGVISKDVNIIPININTALVHLIYQDKSCSGVILFTLKFFFIT